MNMDADRFRVREGQRIHLDECPTRVDAVYESKAYYKSLLADHVKRLSKLQYKLYASNTYALLLIFQAMDTAGKDGAIRHVMSGVNPQGCQVYSFKHPSANELEHDFLWRTTQALPERGRIGIFNRSYYEEVLIARVHPEILRAEGIPDELLDGDSMWDGRYKSIVSHEQHLRRQGTRIVKFFLHISPEEQRKRFLERIDTPQKSWKFSSVDVDERQHWDDYMKAYAQCLSATSTEHAPWYCVPADDKKNARLFISQIILDTLEKMDLKLPQLTEERRQELKAMHDRLAKPQLIKLLVPVSEVAYPEPGLQRSSISRSQVDVRRTQLLKGGSVVSSHMPTRGKAWLPMDWPGGSKR
jgi:PPK2 family polyphosphate:nucleotide phosphotransferase